MKLAHALLGSALAIVLAGALAFARPEERRTPRPDDVVVSGAIADFVVAGHDLVWVDGKAPFTLRARALEGGGERVVAIPSGRPSDLSATSDVALWSEEIAGWKRRIMAVPLAGGTPREIARTSEKPVHVVAAWPDAALVVSDEEVDNTLASTLVLLDRRAERIRRLARARETPTEATWVVSLARAGDRFLYTVLEPPDLYSVSPQGETRREVETDGGATEGATDTVAEIVGATRDRTLLLVNRTPNELVLIEGGRRRSLGPVDGWLPVRAVEHDGDLYVSLRDRKRDGRTIYRVGRGTERLEPVQHVSIANGAIDTDGRRLLYLDADGVHASPFDRLPSP